MNAMPPDRLSAAGYAEYHPVAGHETPEGRAENRRVDLVVLPRTKINFAAQSTAQATGAWRKVTDDE
jgi:chemotaxis protein MotB